MRLSELIIGYEPRLGGPASDQLPGAFDIDDALYARMDACMNSSNADGNERGAAITVRQDGQGLSIRLDNEAIGTTHGTVEIRPVPDAENVWHRGSFHTHPYSVANRAIAEDLIGSCLPHSAEDVSQFLRSRRELIAIVVCKAMQTHPLEVHVLIKTQGQKDAGAFNETVFNETISRFAHAGHQDQLSRGFSDMPAAASHFHCEVLAQTAKFMGFAYYSGHGTVNRQHR
jgi:hypothetical protein